MEILIDIFIKMMGNASRYYIEIVSKSYKKLFPHSEYMISLLLIQGIPIEYLYQQIPCNFYVEIKSVGISKLQGLRVYMQSPKIWTPRTLISP